MLNSPLVWIVDDDTDDQFLLETAFKRVIPPVRIEHLNDGEDLIPHLEQASELPKLILLDLNMPRKNGFDTLTQLRSMRAYQDLPVVVLTTSTANEDREKSLRLGANDFVSKPSRQDQVVALLQQLVLAWRLN